jgi:hypothetical protein
MAGASLLALLDDIATILDDVAVMTKVAAKKTAGVLGDDLALNAQQVAGVRAERELPVVWAVGVGSLKNKLILVPAALAISALLPAAITPLLMVGGLYLCFEGVEKLAHKWLHSADEDAAQHAEQLAHLADPALDLVALEKEKIAGAVRTDFRALGRDHRHCARHRGRQTLRHPGRSAVRHRPADDGGRVWPGGRHRQDGRCRRLAGRARRERAGRARAPDAAGGAEADEGADGDRHGGDVPGRRRHPDARPARRPCAHPRRRSFRGPLAVLATSLVDMLLGVLAGGLALAAFKAVERLRAQR